MANYVFNPFQPTLDLRNELINAGKNNATTNKNNNNGTVDFSTIKGSATYDEDYANHKFQATKTETTETVSKPVSGTIDSVASTKPTAPIFNMYNNQADGTGSLLKRIEFAFMGKTYRFNLNPEEYTQTEPNKVAVMQTKGGAYVDDFGGGVPVLTMRGTTGFKYDGSSPSTNNNGFIKFKELRDLIRNYYFSVAPGSTLTQDKEMIFYNYTDGEHWVVVPDEFKLLRSVSRPLLYSYDIKLYLLRPASVPSAKGGTGQDLGNLSQVEVLSK